MNEPLVTIVIPVYNVINYLEEALESVLSQTYNNLEIVLIDDGSTDGSALLCEEYRKKDSRIKLIHQEHQGLSKARNTGIDCSTGRIIAFLDSDDAFHHEMISRMVKAMHEENADVVICDSITYYTNEHMQEQIVDNNQPVVYNKKDALRALINGEISFYVWNKIYKKGCFDSIRFPEGHVFEDIDTTYKIINASDRIAVIDEPLVMYRRRSGSITVEYSLESSKDRDRAYSHLAEFVEEHTPGIFTEMHKQRINRIRLDSMMETYVRSGKEATSYRKKVLNAATEVDLKQFSIQTLGKYYLIRYCPDLLVLIHKLLWKRKMKKRIEKILYEI